MSAMAVADAGRGNAPKDKMRSAARWSGWMYLLTFVSIPTVALYGAVKEAGYVAGTGPDTGVFVGGLLELIVGLACIGTAVALYPVVKRQSEALAIGFVGTRILEAATIFVGVASLWTVVTLRQSGVGGDALLTGDTLVAFYDRAFLVGQSLIPAINALLIGSLMYQSRLVPRALPVLGFIGAAALITYHVSVVAGFSGEAASLVALLAVLPIATWEFGLGLYLVVKGFRPDAVARLDTVPAIPGSPWPGNHASTTGQSS